MPDHQGDTPPPPSAHYIILRSQQIKEKELHPPPSLGSADKPMGKIITIDHSHQESQEDKTTCC